MANLISAIDRIAFSIGSVEVAWYGILIVLGMMTGLTIVMTQFKRINLTTDDAIEFFLWVIPIAVVMGRLMYVAVRPDEYFDPAIWKADFKGAFVDMIALWDGGITILGGILGGFFGVVGFSIRQRKKANFGQILDLIVPALLVGQLFGRVGNFINQEAFGKPASLLGIPEKFPFAIFIDNPSGVGREYWQMVYDNMSLQPDGTYGGWFAATFFYEMCWNTVGAAIAFCVWRKNKKYPGILAFFYFMWYFLGRALLEYVRIDAVPVTQTLCFVVAPIAVLLGVLYILFTENRSAFRKVNGYITEGTLESAVLSKWEVDNYEFTAKLYRKPNKFLCALYGVNDFAYQTATVSSKEDLKQYRAEMKVKEKEERELEKAKNKEEFAKKIEKIKGFFAKKDKSTTENTDGDNTEGAVEDVKDVEDVESGSEETTEDKVEEVAENVEDENGSDKVTENEIIEE